MSVRICNVADPERFDADPNPIFLTDNDPDPNFTRQNRFKKITIEITPILVFCIFFFKI